MVSGRIDTSGQGPLLGPGAPTDPSEMGYGGTYGGSGGNTDCSSRFFSNTQGQVQLNFNILLFCVVHYSRIYMFFAASL